MVVFLQQQDADVTCLCSNMQILPCVRAHDITCAESVRVLLEGVVVFLQQQADVPMIDLSYAVCQGTHLT